MKILLPLLLSSIVLAESREVIVVVDTGRPTDTSLQKYMCDLPDYDVTGFGLNDVVGHGTEMISMIASSIDPTKTCITSVKWFHSYSDLGSNNPTTNRNRVTAYTKIVLALKPKYLNLSSSGSLYSYPEVKMIAELLNQNSYIMVAAGNDGADLSYKCEAYPACYPFKHKHFRVVASGTNGIRNALWSNFGGPVNSYENGINRYAFGHYSTGTSPATAIFTGRLAAGIIKLD